VGSYQPARYPRSRPLFGSSRLLRHRTEHGSGNKQDGRNETEHEEKISHIRSTPQYRKNSLVRAEPADYIQWDLANKYGRRAWRSARGRAALSAAELYGADVEQTPAGQRWHVALWLLEVIVPVPAAPVPCALAVSVNSQTPPLEPFTQTPGK